MQIKLQLNIKQPHPLDWDRHLKYLAVLNVFVSSHPLTRTVVYNNYKNELNIRLNFLSLYIVSKKKQQIKQDNKMYRLWKITRYFSQLLQITVQALTQVKTRHQIKH